MGILTTNLIGAIAYRVAAPAYYQRALSPIGARSFAGRFNPVGISVLYFSLEHDTAVSEYYGTDLPKPAVILPVMLNIKSLVDLRGDLARFPAIWRDWDCDWKAARHARTTDPNADCSSWRCGRDVIKRNCSGVIFPSTKRKGGINVAVFPEHAIFGNCEILPMDKAGEIAALHPAKRRGSR